MNNDNDKIPVDNEHVDTCKKKARAENLSHIEPVDLFGPDGRKNLLNITRKKVFA